MDGWGDDPFDQEYMWRLLEHATQEYPALRRGDADSVVTWKEFRDDAKKGEVKLDIAFAAFALLIVRCAVAQH